MVLKQGPGWSPDGGKFWIDNDKIYWHDGDIDDISLPIRVMPGYSHDEDYSQWSDEHRAMVKAEWVEKRKIISDGNRHRGYLSK